MSVKVVFLSYMTQSELRYNGLHTADEVRLAEHVNQPRKDVLDNMAMLAMSPFTATLAEPSPPNRSFETARNLNFQATEKQQSALARSAFVYGHLDFSQPNINLSNQAALENAGRY